MHAPPRQTFWVSVAETTACLVLTATLVCGVAGDGLAFLARGGPGGPGVGTEQTSLCL